MLQRAAEWWFGTEPRVLVSDLDVQSSSFTPTYRLMPTMADLARAMIGDGSMQRRLGLPATVSWEAVVPVCVVGEDVVSSLPRWKEADALLRDTQFVVVPRPPSKLRCEHSEADGGQAASSPPRPPTSPRGYPAKLLYLDRIAAEQHTQVVSSTGSSTLARNRLGGLGVDSLASFVPPLVRDYAKEHALYGSRL